MATASSTIAGLVNFGNTCYANALLQALASCQSFTEYIEMLYTTFQVPQVPGFVPEDWKTSLPLIRSLYLCIKALQPNKKRSSAPCSALEVLHSIGMHNRRLFSGSGEQQDVTEVLDCIAEACREELNAWGRRFLTKRGLFFSYKDPEVDGIARVLRNTGNGIRNAKSMEMHSINIDQFQSLNSFDGLLSRSLDCCQCGHVFDMQLDPFTFLILPIPHVRSDGWEFVVDEATRLETCLHDFFASKRQGPINCPKCSFWSTISVERKTDMTIFRTPRNSTGSVSRRSSTSTDEELNNSKRRRSLGLVDILTESQEDGVVVRSRASFDIKEFHNNKLKPCPLNPISKEAMLKEIISEARNSTFSESQVQKYTQRLKQLGIEWIRTDSHVNSATAIAKIPKVLVISINRKVFDGTSYKKIKGRVSYPFTLDIADYIHFTSNNSTVYKLKAVLIHHGDEDGGHYLTVRSLDAQGVDWVLASDDKVYTITESAAMGMEASLLFYERQPKIEDYSEEKESVTTADSFIDLTALGR